MYGLSEDNLILLGLRTGKSERKELYSYINRLTGPNGETIECRRKGACCGFKTPHGLFDGTGVLEVWEITYEGLTKPTTLFVNVYDYGEPASPVGFRLER